MPRTLASEVSAQDIVTKASKSDLIWSMSAHDAMKHFGFRHDALKAAQRLALAERPVEVAEALARNEDLKQVERLARAEARYPMIHRKLAIGSESDAELARQYNLTRMRVGQFKHEFKAVAEKNGKEPLAFATDLERQAAGMKVKPRAKAKKRRTRAR